MQESGVPNIWGHVWAQDDTTGTDGAFKYVGDGRYNWRGTNPAGFLQSFDASRCSYQYINNLNEIRVKSIISNGYIRLY